jgi:hypothetical protein
VRGLLEALEAGTLDAVRVVAVDGNAVRNELDIEFALGGHRWRFPFIPEDEVWIERTIAPGVDLAAIVIHELTERTAMKMLGLPYEVAHQLADAAEGAVRVQRRA